MDRDWNSIMFDDIGVKMQKAAKVIAWVNIVASIIGGFVMLFFALSNMEELWFLILLAPIMVTLGCIIAWLSVITLYGFGKLIEDTEAIRNKKPPVIKAEKEEKDQTVPKRSQHLGKNKGNISKEPSEKITKTIGGLPKNEKEEPKIVPCPECGEDLEFMGWDDNDLRKKQTCPLCGKEILLKK